MQTIDPTPERTPLLLVLKATHSSSLSDACFLFPHDQRIDATTERAGKYLAAGNPDIFAADLAGAIYLHWT